MRCALTLALLLAACVHGPHEQMDPLTFDQLSAPGPMRTARVGEHEVAFFHAGVGAPVVLVHGLGEHAGYWNDNVSALLRAEVRLVVPDLLGHGRSDKPRDGYRMTEQAARLAGLLDALAIDEPVVLVGHSMGGQIAIHFALAWPERVRALVLLAPAGIERFTRGEAAWLKAVSTTDGFRSRDEGQLRDHFQKNVFHRFGESAEHHLGERVRLRHAPGFERYIYAVVKSIHGMLDEPVADHLATLEVPVTVVFGDRDGLIPNPILHGGSAADVAEAAGRLIPKARVVLLEGVGHMPQIEAPAEVNQLILEAAR